MRVPQLLYIAVVVAWLSCVAAVPPQLDDLTNTSSDPLSKHRKSPFSSPSGLFIQERASKGLPGPGQHVNFGALISWEKIHDMITPGRKLLFLVRHGQAVSNWLQDYLGPDKWFEVEETCSYKDDDGTVYDVFDAELTKDGEDQAQKLNDLLKDKWFDTITAGKHAAAVVSPLSRCLHTLQLVMEGLPIHGEPQVEELCRETLGEDTCDARRSVDDPEQGEERLGKEPCSFRDGLATKFPDFSFPVLGDNKNDFGLFHNKDKLWTKDREHQKEQTRRAMRFLELVFDRCKDDVVFVITHSGFTRSVLLAVGREPYRPQNTEVVPVLVEYEDYAAPAARQA